MENIHFINLKLHMNTIMNIKKFKLIIADLESFHAKTAKFRVDKMIEWKLITLLYIQ